MSLWIYLLNSKTNLATNWRQFALDKTTDPAQLSLIRMLMNLSHTLIHYLSVFQPQDSETRCQEDKIKQVTITN